MNPIEFGKFIASLRNEKNLTQEELAEKLFIDKRKVSRWECGTSMPEFDMLIKLSEILDVSLYELSICKRIKNECITTRLINSFRNIRDFKKYKAKKKILVIIFIILFIMLLITSIYTIKYNDTVELYELISMDNSYNIDGNYIRAKDYSLFNINNIGIVTNNKEENESIFKNCEYEVIDNDIRKFYILNNDKKYINSYKTIYSYSTNDKSIKLSEIITLKVNCTNRKKIENFSFDVKLSKKYSNKLF